jgi:hypothetical protein
VGGIVLTDGVPAMTFVFVGMLLRSGTLVERMKGEGR